MFSLLLSSETMCSLPNIPPVGRNCHKCGNCRNTEHPNFFHLSIKQFLLTPWNSPFCTLLGLEAWTSLHSQETSRLERFLEMMFVKSTNNKPPLKSFSPWSCLVQFKCSPQNSLPPWQLVPPDPSKLTKKFDVRFGAFGWKKQTCSQGHLRFQWTGWNWPLRNKKTGRTPLQPEFAFNAARLPQTCTWCVSSLHLQLPKLGWHCL